MRAAVAMAAVVMVREVSAWVVEAARAPAMAGVEDVASASAHDFASSWCLIIFFDPLVKNRHR